MGKDHASEPVKRCTECGREFAEGEKAYEARLEGEDRVFWFHRDCFEDGYGYDPEFHEPVDGR